MQPQSWCPGVFVSKAERGTTALRFVQLVYVTQLLKVTLDDMPPQRSSYNRWNISYSRSGDTRRTPSGIGTSGVGHRVLDALLSS